MPDPVVPTGHRPASTEEIITALANKEGIPPYLALAVARKESGIDLNQNAVGDGGLALGTFQLHSGAAQDVNVDRADPMGNLMGGVKYLKLLRDRYQGDPIKVLSAYNGGMGNVDKGTVSPAAQAYAAEVMADVTALASQAKRRQVGGRGSGAGPVGTTVNPSAPGEITTPYTPPTVGSMAASALKFADPRTKEGQENLLGMAGDVGLMVATKGLPAGPILKAARFMAPTVGSAIGGAVSTALTGEDLTTAAGRQATYNVLGRAVIWPLTSVFKRLVAPSVARAASKGIAAEHGAVTETGRVAVQSVRDDLAETLRILRQSGRQVVRGVTERVDKYIKGAKQFAEGQVGDVKLGGRATIADAEADAAASLDRAKEQYSALYETAPSTEAVSQAVGETVGGFPETIHLEQGPAKRAYDISGKRVEQAAKGGPAIDLVGVQTAIRQIAHDMRPRFLTEGVGPSTPRVVAGSELKRLPSGGRMSREEYEAVVRREAGLEAEHPLPGLLGDVLNSPLEKIPFSDAHKLKVLLDKSVNWSRTAKSAAEQLVKGVRVTLRRAMRGYAPYDEATAAHEFVTRQYTSEIGQKLLNRAADNPDALVGLLDTNGPSAARTLKTILLGESAKGGDAALGQRAWDGIRSAYTYRKLTSGPVDTLAQRVRTLRAEHPEFTQEVFGDAPGQQILSNLEQLGVGIETAVEKGRAGITAAKQAAGDDLLAATVRAERGVASARVIGEGQVYGAQEAARQATEGAQRSGRIALRSTEDAARTATTAAEAKAIAFGESSLRAYAGKRAVEEEFADAWRAALLAPRGSFLGGLSLVRLVMHPVKGQDLLTYIAYSPKLTQLYVKGLTGQLPPRLMGVLLREVGRAYALGPSDDLLQQPAAQ